MLTNRRNLEFWNLLSDSSSGTYRVSQKESPIGYKKRFFTDLQGYGPKLQDCLSNSDKFFSMGRKILVESPSQSSTCFAEFEKKVMSWERQEIHHFVIPIFFAITFLAEPPRHLGLGENSLSNCVVFVRNLKQAQAYPAS